MVQKLHHTNIQSGSRKVWCFASRKEVGCDVSHQFIESGKCLTYFLLGFILRLGFCIKLPPALHIGKIRYALAICTADRVTQNFRHSALDAESWKFWFPLSTEPFASLIPLLGLNSACAIKDCFVHFANATFTTAVVLCSVPCSTCQSASRHRHSTLAHAYKKKVTTFCDLNNNLGRRFWDSL